MKPIELSNSEVEMQVRKSYIKPGIERVRLVAEETVLGGCKTLGAPGGEGDLSSCTLSIAPCGTDPGS